MKEVFYTPEQVGDMFKRSAYTIRRWITEGRIEAFKVGRRLLISEKEIKRIIREAQKAQAKREGRI